MTLKDLRAAEVAAIGNGVEIVGLQNSLRLLGNIGKLCPIRAAIRHLVGDDQMMLGIDCDLDIVSTTPEPRPLVAIERLSGSVSEIC